MRTCLALGLLVPTLLAIPSSAYAGAPGRTIVIQPANNTGQTLDPVGSGSGTTTRYDGGLMPLPNGDRGLISWDSWCGLLCPIWASASYEGPGQNPHIDIEAHNPMSGANSASCSATAPWRCDISYNRSGANLVVNTNVYWSGYAAVPAPKVHVTAPALVSSRRVLRGGLDLSVGASRLGTVTTTLTRVGTRASAALHGRSVKRIVLGGPDHPATLRLNRRGRAAVRKAGVVRYRLRSTFRDQDGRSATRTRRVTVVDPSR